MFAENSYDISCTSRINSHGQNPIAASQILLTTASTPLLSTHHCNHLLSVFIYQGNCCKICNSSTVQLSCITGKFNYSAILNTWTAQLLPIWKQFIFVIIKQYLYDVLSNYLETTAYYSDVSLFCFALSGGYIAVKPWYARSYGNWYRVFEIFHILCERGTPKDFSELHLYLLPTLPHPLQIYQQYQEPHPIGPAALPAPASWVLQRARSRDSQATYHIHTSTHKHARKRKRISSSYNIIVAKPAWTLGL